MDPASNKQNPACIQKTKTVPIITHNELRLDLSAYWLCSKMLFGSIGSPSGVSTEMPIGISVGGINEVMFDVSFDIFSIALRILVI